MGGFPAQKGAHGGNRSFRTAAERLNHVRSFGKSRFLPDAFS